MKHNATDMDVEEMAFHRLTLVINPPGSARKMAPVNPDAVLLAVKAGEDKEKGPIRHLLAALKLALVGDGPMETPLLTSRKAGDGDGPDDEGAADVASVAVANAKNQGVHAAMMNHTADLQNKLQDIHYHPTMSDGDKKSAMKDAIAEHGLKTTALAGAMYAKKAEDAIEEAAKAGARHSKADLADLQAAHDHLESTHASLSGGIDKMTAARTSIEAAKAHTGKLLGKTDDPCDDPADAGAGALKAQTNEEDEMKPEDIAALTEAMKAAVVAGMSEAVKSMPQPAAPVDVTEANAALAASIVTAVKADIVALDAKIATLEANIATKVDEATKAAAEAQKPEVEKLAEAAKNANATAAAATKAAEAANSLVKDAIKASRDRQAPGGHLTAIEALSASKSDDPKTPQQIAEEVKKIPSHVDRIHHLLHS
jgi:hypothetical protein